MLKFNLKTERLNFMHGWMMPEKQMVDDDAEEDLLRVLLQGDFQDGLDRVIHAISNDED